MYDLELYMLKPNQTRYRGLGRALSSFKATEHMLWVPLEN